MKVRTWNILKYQNLNENIQLSIMLIKLYTFTRVTWAGIDFLAVFLF